MGILLQCWWGVAEWSGEKRPLVEAGHCVQLDFLRLLTSQHTERRLRFFPAHWCRDFLEALTTVQQEKGRAARWPEREGFVVTMTGF